MLSYVYFDNSNFVRGKINKSIEVKKAEFEVFDGSRTTNFSTLDELCDGNEFLNRETLTKLINDEINTCVVRRGIKLYFVVLNNDTTIRKQQ